jgi:hypothetical protein
MTPLFRGAYPANDFFDHTPDRNGVKLPLRILRVDLDAKVLNGPFRIGVLRQNAILVYSLQKQLPKDSRLGPLLWVLVSGP